MLVSTHNLAEAEALSDRIAILRTKVLAFDTIGALKSRSSGMRVAVDIEGDAAGWAPEVERLGAAAVGSSGTRLEMTVADESRIPDVVSALVAAGARITRVMPEPRTLEEVYLDLVGGD